MIALAFLYHGVTSMVIHGVTSNKNTTEIDNYAIIP